MLFSIVIPIYNVEKYLDECKQSILQQLDSINNDCEILLIDDGSTDNSGKICDEYMIKFPTLVKTFHKENQGLLATRRYGFQRASGEFIVNCDSDDLLEKGMLASVQGIINKYENPDVIIFNHYSYDGKNKTIAYENIFSDKKDCLIPKEKVLREYLMGHSVVSMCGKIVKRICIDIKQDYSEYGRLSTGEDTLQSLEFYSNANTFVYLNEPLYDYRCGSGMTAKFDSNYYFTFKRIFDQIEIEKNKWNLNDFDELFAIKVLQTSGRAITQSRYNKWKSINEQRQYLKKIRDDSMLEDNLKYLLDVKEKLQIDHYILLKFLKARLFNLIILVLKIRNII